MKLATMNEQKYIEQNNKENLLTALTVCLEYEIYASTSCIVLTSSITEPSLKLLQNSEATYSQMIWFNWWSLDLKK
jgi:hypothetical protein